MLEHLEFVTPIRVNSRDEVSVEDQNGVEVLTLQKFFKNKIELILSSIRPGFFTNIKVIENSKTVVKSKDIFTLGRNKWDIEIQKNDGTNEAIRLKDKSVVSTNPRAEFEVGQKNYKIEHDFGEKITTVYSEENTIAELKYVKRLPTIHNELRIFTDDIDSRLLLCALYTFEQAT
ncbi:hypothetical protein [Lentibacillus sp. CBA3610]|uniref:tubby C-terminal domain-like protein n=1 Tax=Lentibacillus sp. CBA3610 TaxID=2518176 RepID=UPI001595474C|nr:hypothetical protein [Lentibacillus sp. CBA3610]QKY71274.1 hypothetical protein Len3610_18495 [Lentibacillus sp. CBA3610]